MSYVLVHVHLQRRAAACNRTLERLWLHPSRILTKPPWHCAFLTTYTQRDPHPSPFRSSPRPSPTLSPSLFYCYSGSSPHSLVLFNFYFFCSAEGAAPGEHYFQKASSCIIVRIHALISWTIWQTAYAPSSLNALHLLIKWMSHCFQSNTLNLCASLYVGCLSQTRFFLTLQRL